ncbi:hypothetical protein COCON_G00047390 [Conger conger]|uniref:Uncharacterized protein n=1 Tax=Conger conger TaxID=82655 RepID=A0A9Q1DUV2_CONCO|nr:hypothetical protein COCON_G00047390 [Conger conger]
MSQGQEEWRSRPWQPVCICQGQKSSSPHKNRMCFNSKANDGLASTSPQREMSSPEDNPLGPCCWLCPLIISMSCYYCL